MRVATGVLLFVALLSASCGTRSSATAPAETGLGSPVVPTTFDPGSTQEPSAAIGDSPGASPLEAAIALVELKEQLVTLTPEAAAAVVSELAAPGSGVALADAVRSDVAAVRSAAPAGAVLRVAPIEAEVRNQSATAATVAVWAVQVFTGAGSVRVGYSTIVHELVLVDGVWLLSGVSVAPGPVPEPTQDPTGPLAFESRLAGFDDVRVVE